MNFRVERRLSPRRNTRIEAKIAFDGGRSVRSCVIRNVSETGARLELSSVSGVPETFDLLIAGHAPQPCRVVWRALREMGVAYRS
jgi:PilZ domain